MRPAKTSLLASKITAAQFVYTVHNMQAFCVAVVLLAALAANAGEITVKNTGPKSVTSIRAFLYYQETGEFSRQDFLAGWVALRNVITGHTYDVESPSGAFLLLIGVRYPLIHDVPSSTVIRVTVKQKSTPIINQEIPLREFFSEADSIQVPFVVYRTGCYPLEITASLVEKKKTISSLSRTADFNCGE
jgi:hypothetical protein